MSKLHGKVAVITGGSTGIGLATARRFVEEGAYVFITGRRQTELEKARALIGKNVTIVQGDVTNLDDLDRLVKTVAAEKEVVDVIFTSAGLVEQQTIGAATPEHFDKTFNLNARAVFFTVQKLLPLMTNGGSIVLVSSAMHYLGNPGHSAYAATKAAARTFYRTWAAELKDRGIRVNTLGPGITDTLMSSSQDDATRRIYISIIPMDRIGLPEEMASAALFLASSESSFSISTDLVVDGGIEASLVEQIGWALLHEMQSSDFNTRLYAESLANVQAFHVSRHCSTLQQKALSVTSGLSKMRLRQVLDYIHKYSDHDLSVTELALVAEVSASHFAHLFRQTMGMAPHQYLIACRVEQARQLLLTEDVSLHELALRCGFADQSHLTRHFRRLVGVTPGLFRKDRRNIQDRQG